MKTTDYQKQLCDIIEQQVNFYKNSNDINSPTHYSDNEETINMLDWDEEESKHLAHLLDELLNIIKHHPYEKSKYYCGSCIHWKVDTTKYWESTYHPHFSVKVEGICAGTGRVKLNCQRACYHFMENEKLGKFYKV